MGLIYLVTPKCGRIKDMLKERKVYIILRKIEKENKGKEKIPITKLVSAVLSYSKTKKCFSLLRFDDNDEVLRIIKSLSGKGHTIEKEAIIGTVCVKVIETKASADNEYALRYFWSNFLSAMGFWKVLTAIGIIVALLPNGFGSKLLQLLIDLNNQNIGVTKYISPYSIK